VCCSVLQCFAVCCSVLQRVAVCCSVLQCVAVCYSVLQCGQNISQTKRILTLFAHLMRWLRLVGSSKLYVSFAEYSLFYRALLQKGPIILRSLLIVAKGTYNFKEPTNRSHHICHGTYVSRHKMYLAHCNTLLYAATHCNTLQHIATHCNTHCNTYFL